MLASRKYAVVERERKRHEVQRDRLLVVIDEHRDGTLVAEIDDGDQPSQGVSNRLHVLGEVSNE